MKPVDAFFYWTIAGGAISVLLAQIVNTHTGVLLVGFPFSIGMCCGVVHARKLAKRKDT